jgi:hypothetical protein
MCLCRDFQTGWVVDWIMQLNADGLAGKPAIVWGFGN